MDALIVEPRPEPSNDLAQSALYVPILLAWLGRRPERDRRCGAIPVEWF
jgi:hypothetical protein